MAVHHGCSELSVAAPPEACLAALTDVERMPQWQSALERTQVLERDADGNPTEVSYTVDVKVGKVSYRLEHAYLERPGGGYEVTSDYVDGDFECLGGGWTLTPEGHGTSVRLELWIDPGVWVPGRVARMIHDRVLRGSLEDLKRQVEAHPVAAR